MQQSDQHKIDALMAHLPTKKANAINAPDLARLLGYLDAPNQEELRDVIRMAIGQKKLIGSSNSGYWKLSSREDLEEVLNSLQGRAQGVCKRRNNLLEAWNEQFGDKCNLPKVNVL